MKSFRFIGIALGITLAASPTLATAKPKDLPPPSAPREVVNPYKPALECLATQLTPDQKSTSIAVGYLLDRTGKDSYSQESASGKFLGQAGDDMLITALAMTGVEVVGFNPSYRQSFDWQLPKVLAGGIEVPHAFPEILIEGSFSSFDFGSSSVKELYVFGIGGGTRAYSIRYTMDIRATALPGRKFTSGKVLSTLALEKDVIGREKRAGVASFFGNAGDSTYVEFNINSQKRELVQYSQRYMISRAAFGIVADLWKITACNEALAYSDALVSGQVMATKAPS